MDPSPLTVASGTVLCVHLPCHCGATSNVTNECVYLVGALCLLRIDMESKVSIIM